MADIVAGDLRERILSGELADGDELPVEAVLLEEFAVSRPSLREALRILETEGLIWVRRGNRGGSVVRRPTPEVGAYHLGLVLQSTGVTLGDLAQARSMIEPLCFGLAAERSDHGLIADQLDHLTDLATELIDHEAEFTSSLLEFHQEAIRLSGNSTLAVLVGTVESVWEGQEHAWARRNSLHGSYPDRAGRLKALKAHRRIASDIRAGNVDASIRSSRLHIAATSELVSSASLDGGRRAASLPISAKALRT